MVALDTSVFIYQLEADPKYVDFAEEVFAWIERPGHGAVASTVTMTELMTKPYRDFSQARINEIHAWYSTVPQLRWIPSDLGIADLAAQLRARYRLRTPDALHAATAIRAGATGLISNDPVFRRVPGFETVLFDELL